MGSVEDRCIRWGGDRRRGRGSYGVNLECPIVTNEAFAMRSSQITFRTCYIGLKLPQKLLLPQHPFNGPLSETTRVLSQYQKGKSNLDFMEQETAMAVITAGLYANLHLAPDR